MHSGVDAHWLLVRIFVRDALIHVEQIPVAFGDRVLAKPIDRVGKVEIYAESTGADTATIITGFLGCAGRDVTRRQIAEARILALEEVIALRFGNGRRRTMIPLLDRHPHASVVAQRLRHERELRLMVAAHGNAGGMNLRVAGVGERRALLVRTPRGRRVRQHGVRAEVKHVAIPARGEYHGIRRVRRDLAGEQVARHDPARMPVDDDHVEHFFERVHLHALEGDLALQRRIRAEQQLLTGLSACVKRARDLRAAERSVGQQATVLAGERHTLRHALIDDVHRQLSETVYVGFTGAEVAALDGVVKQPTDGIAIVLIILGRVDAALRGDRVRSARRIVIHEARHLVSHLRHAGRGRRTGETGADNDHTVTALVGRVHQLHRETVLVPLLLEGTARCLCVQVEHISGSPQRASPAQWPPTIRRAVVPAQTCRARRRSG